MRSVKENGLIREKVPIDSRHSVVEGDTTVELLQGLYSESVDSMSTPGQRPQMSLERRPAHCSLEAATGMRGQHSHKEARMRYLCLQE